MKLETDGLDQLIADMEKVMELPDRVQEDMLNAEADVVVRAQRDELTSQNLVNTGQLRESIARNNKVKTDGKGGIGKYLDIYPQGTRNDGVRNAEVGFILEYGAPGRKLKAYHWMKSANEKSTEKAVEAAAGVYDEFLKKVNF